MEPLVFKRADSTIAGPAYRFQADGAVDLELSCVYQYESLTDLGEALESLSSPDFSKAISMLVSLGVNVPNESVLVGLKELKRITAKLLNDYRTLVSMRTDAMGIQSEWVSLQHMYRKLIAEAEMKARDSVAYKDLKNVEARSHFVESSCKEYRWIELAITIAIQRCSDFVEICRVKGKELDTASSMLGIQMGLINYQVKLGQYSPEEG